MSFTLKTTRIVDETTQYAMTNSIYQIELTIILFLLKTNSQMNLQTNLYKSPSKYTNIDPFDFKQLTTGAKTKEK